MLTRQQVLAKLCHLTELVHNRIDPEGQHPNDCFCKEGGFWKSKEYADNPNTYRNDGFVLRFVVKAVCEKLRREQKDSQLREVVEWAAKECSGLPSNYPECGDECKIKEAGFCDGKKFGYGICDGKKFHKEEPEVPLPDDPLERGSY